MIDSYDWQELGQFVGALLAIKGYQVEERDMMHPDSIDYTFPFTAKQSGQQRLGAVHCASGQLEPVDVSVVTQFNEARITIRANVALLLCNGEVAPAAIQAAKSLKVRLMDTAAILAWVEGLSFEEQVELGRRSPERMNPANISIR